MITSHPSTSATGDTMIVDEIQSPAWARIMGLGSGTAARSVANVNRRYAARLVTRRYRITVPLSTALAAFAFLASAAPAEAHGLVIRQDLPVPDWLFGWAAAVVLIVSFVALAVLWPEPKLEHAGRRALPAWLSRPLTSPLLETACGAVGVALLALVIWSGIAGTQAATANLAPTFVYIVFWLGMVAVTVLFGDVFRLFNPWRALGRAYEPLRRRLDVPPYNYPEWLGRWPAVLGLMAFAWLELVNSYGDRPDTVALATLAYTVVTLFAIWLFGVERWMDRGETFSVYFGLLARLSPFERKGRDILLRPPLSGLATQLAVPGSVAFVVAMIGIVTFDGFSAGQTWQQDFVPTLHDFFKDLGLGPRASVEAVLAVGLVGTVLAAGAFYMLGILGARSMGGGYSQLGLARAFVSSLVPIALAYIAAHYVSLLLLQGQAVAPLASDPLGRGWDLFGTASWAVDLYWLGFYPLWYMQVGFVVAGHVAAFVVAHDRALTLYDERKTAVRSPYWMLGVMVGFTLLALALLSEASKG